MRSKVTPAKVGVRWKSQEDLSRERLKISLVQIHQIGKGFTFSGIEINTPVLRSTPQANLGCLCGLRSSTYKGIGGPDCKVVGINRAADGSR